MRCGAESGRTQAVNYGCPWRRSDQTGKRGRDDEPVLLSLRSSLALPLINTPLRCNPHPHVLQLTTPTPSFFSLFGAVCRTFPPRIGLVCFDPFGVGAVAVPIHIPSLETYFVDSYLNTSLPDRVLPSHGGRHKLSDHSGQQYR